MELRDNDGNPLDDQQAAALAAARAARETETSTLIARAVDPNDPYDGHHGNDRSEASLEYARIHNPELAARIEQKITTGATE